MGPGGRVLVDPVRDAPDPGVEAGLAQSEEAGQVPLGRAGHSRHCQGAVVCVLTGCYLYHPPPLSGRDTQCLGPGGQSCVGDDRLQKPPVPDGLSLRTIHLDSILVMGKSLHHRA